MFDMILAIDWVRDYIRFFGGNPDKIVAFGHGTGASSAMMLSLSKFCKSNRKRAISHMTNRCVCSLGGNRVIDVLTDSFSGLIAMSGSILSHFAVDKNPADSAKNIARENGCPINNVRKMVSCLRELPVEKLIGTDSKLENVRMRAQGFISGLSNLLGPGPVSEGADDNR